MQTNQLNSEDGTRKMIDERMMDDGRIDPRPSSLVPRSSSFRPRASLRQRAIAAAICAAIAAFFGVFAVAGHYRVDMGQWLGYCGFQQKTGLPCPTCGMTTATLAFAQGRIIEAFYTQPAGGLLCSFMVLVALLALVVAVSGIYPRFIQRFFAEVKIRYIVLALVVVIAAGWAVTLAREL
ncbi:MAG: hypothetical protein A2Z25_05255 [Planctomycetes bacterium RBG_16_55_9]|nr:MAG: hypothetical protein A2Z25_05255 [Planctomycetes bacterium RBG_16_55_9]